MRRLNLTQVFIGVLGCCGLLSITAQAQVVVRMETSLGDIDVELYDETAPITTTNFMNYVRDGDYTNTFFHRSALNPVVIQGGGYLNLNGIYPRVPADAPIVNEYGDDRPNSRGTIAMARTADPNSATSEWFFNIEDNSATLDSNNNGGYAVFGRVLGSNDDSITTNDGDSMAVVDAIAALDRWQYSVWSEIPFIGYSVGQPVTFDHFVMINSVRAILNIQDNLAVVENHVGNLVALTAIAPATLSNVAVSAAPNDNAPNGVTFQEGFFSFQIDGLTPGASTSVAMQLPSSYVPNTYYMYGPTPDNHNTHWYEFKFDGQTGAEFFGNNFVVLNFVDGGRGDADLTANGQISDPGAPGISTVTTVAPSSSSGGGGCTLASNPRAPSIPVDFGMLALIFLVYKLKYSQARSNKATIHH